MIGDSLEFKEMFDKDYRTLNPAQFKKGGKVSSAKSSKTASASKRGDGIAQRGKTRGRMV
jgi:hypothetical protein